MDEPGFSTVPRHVWQGAVHEAAPDLVAREEPLAIRLGPAALAVVMRTPGHDLELARGFVITEGILRREQIGRVAPCSSEDNVVQVIPAAGVEVDVARFVRHTYTSSSCGVCGKATLEQAMRTAPALGPGPLVSRRILSLLPDRLRAQQALFERTGGLHAAGLFALDGTPLCVREDVGRHNAVDKVVGATEAAEALLCVSGRVSFEIVQKALAASLSVIVAVSAPTSLAVELAAKSGILLAGFARGERLAIYSGAERLTA